MTRYILAACVCLGVTMVSSHVGAVCDEHATRHVRAGHPGLSDEQKLQALDYFGCDDPEIRERIAAKRHAEQVAREEAEERRAVLAAQKKAEDEAQRKLAAEVMAARLAADKVRNDEEDAQRDAFEQAMADKCGEYPLDLKIGTSEKLLKMGCAGQADLRGETVGGVRVYWTAYLVPDRKPPVLKNDPA